MLEYVILFALMIVIAIPLCMINPSKKKNIIYLGIIFGIFYIMTILRFGIGNDYFSYYDIFMNCKNAEDIGTLFGTGIEPAFVLLNKLISFFTDDIRIIYGIYGLCILVPAGIAIYKYSRNVWISCIVYVSFTFFYASMSFIRQSIAASIILLAFYFVKEKKILPVILLSLLATCFHFTSLIFLPFFFLSFIKISKKYLITYGIINVVLYAAYQILLNGFNINPLNWAANLATIVFGRDFNSYIDTIYFSNGFSIAYTIMPALMLAFLLIAYYKGWGKNNSHEVQVYVNFMLYTFSFWLFATIIFILERFSMYMFIYIVLAVPSVLEHYQDTINQQIAKLDMKKPGSKAIAERGKDNYMMLTALVVVGSLAYNIFGMTQNFHGVFPYTSMIPQIEEAKNSMLGDEGEINKLRTARNIYDVMLLADNPQYDYVIVGKMSSFRGIDTVTRSIMEYCGLDISLLENENCSYYVYCRGGEVVTQRCESGAIDDTITIGDNNNLNIHVPAANEAGYPNVYSDLYERNCALDFPEFNITVFDNSSGELVSTLNVNTTTYKMQAAIPTYA